MQEIEPEEKTKEVNPDEPSRAVTSGDEPSRVDTTCTDIDIDIDMDIDSDNDNDSDMDSEMTNNSAFAPSYTLEQIEIIAHAIAEETDGEYPYVTRLVEKFHEINSSRGWLGTNGKPITNIVQWYKQFLDYEMDNGYQMKYVSVCED